MISKRVLDESDLIVFVLDAGKVDEDDNQIYSLVKDKNHIVVVNKTDVSDIKDNRADIYVSAKTGDNLEGLKSLIYKKSVGEGIDINGDFLCEERHFNALTRAREKFAFALNAIESVSLDILAIDIKDGWDALGEISGRTATEDIINNIFSKFCVGK